MHCYAAKKTNPHARSAAATVETAGPQCPIDRICATARKGFACRHTETVECPFAMRSPSSVPIKTRSSRYILPIPTSALICRGDSDIHGAGVYARIAIPTGHVIVEYRGERITKAESERREAARLARIRRGRDSCTYIFNLNQRHDLDARRSGNISRFINHSCQPNCRSELEHGHIWIIAERDIPPGEEITFDYGFPFRDWAENPCRCGAARCAGFIVAENQRWRLRRMKRARP